MSGLSVPKMLDSASAGGVGVGVGVGFGVATAPTGEAVVGPLVGAEHPAIRGTISSGTRARRFKAGRIHQLSLRPQPLPLPGCLRQYLARQGSLWYIAVVPADGLVSQMRRGALEYCVMALIVRTPRYAFELIEALGKTGFLPTGGTLY